MRLMTQHFLEQRAFPATYATTHRLTGADRRQAFKGMDKYQYIKLIYFVLFN